MNKRKKLIWFLNSWVLFQWYFIFFYKKICCVQHYLSKIFSNRLIKPTISYKSWYLDQTTAQGECWQSWLQFKFTFILLISDDFWFVLKIYFEAFAIFHNKRNIMNLFTHREKSYLIFESEMNFFRMSNYSLFFVIIK